MISTFTEQYAYLSNFYSSPIVWNDTYVYPTAEHLFQAHKVLAGEPGWIENLRKIRLAPSPMEAKRLGRNVRLRPDWDQRKKRVMFDVVLAKFEQHEHLRRRLVDTDDHELVEGNTWGDLYWGAVWSQDLNLFVGRNHLGKTLMFVRDLLAG